jgi:signal transduction histidine kinase
MDYNQLLIYTKDISVLLVEDNEMIRESTKRLLSNYFSKLDSAIDGKDALYKYKIYHNTNNLYYDLIITDLSMPKMNGEELIKSIYKINEDQSIVVISAHSESSQLINLIQLGIGNYILKPIDIKKLSEMLYKMCKSIYAQKKLNIYNQTLYDANKELVSKNFSSEQKLDIIKDDMITIFTHELKTPLNAIINFSEFMIRNLEKTLTDKKIKQFKEISNQIYMNGISQLDMINAILEVAKIKSGKMTINKKQQNIALMLNENIKIYNNMYNKITQTNIDETIIARVDKKLYNMIFINLYSNAIKNSKSKVLVSLMKISQDKFELIVEDDGLGIPMDKRKKIFEMFEQADKTVLKREATGTGIGLYTVKNLVDLCGCSVILEDSKILGGARFTIVCTL